MVNIEIDGKKLHAREGAMVIEAADDAGIYIPRFCYHKKLSIAANCRMCLIEVEKVAKALPACATPVTDGMKIFTRSPRAIAAQKGVMEFLLINHPLDCPICDQGGECELQDIAVGYGADNSEYSEAKRVVENKDFGPLISGEMTRCIHCTRCVRFGEEIAGLKQMGATGRGEHMEIGTYVQMSLSSEMSGNIIDLCPVGALTSKPYRFTARAWEITQRNSIAPHDCIGSNIKVHTFRNEVVRVVPNDNEAINETWLSDRDRFSYEGLNSEERLTAPMVKVDGTWQEVDWDTALHKVYEGMAKIVSEKGVDEIGAIASPTMTTEELYLLQRLMRGIGSHNIDHRLAETDFSGQEDAPLFPWLGQSIEELENNDAILLIGSNVRHDQPIAAHRIRKAAMGGSRIMCVNAVDFDFNFPVAAKKISSPARQLGELAAILKALAQQAGSDLPSGLDTLLANISVDETHVKIAAELNDAAESTVIMGHDAFAHTQFSSLRTIASQIAKLSSSKLGFLSDGSNGAGAWLAGAVPHRDAGAQPLSTIGKNLKQMLHADLAGYFLLGIEPELDCTESAQALAAMQQANFVVSMNAFCNDAMKEYSDVMLPITPFTETSGTFVNAEGRWQSFDGVVEPRGEARPGWKVLRVLGNLFDCEGFDYTSSREVLDEIKSCVGDSSASNDLPWICPDSLGTDAKGMQSIVDRPMYSGDCLVRRATSLQQVAKSRHFAIRVNQSVASKIGLSNGEQAMAKNNSIEVTLPIIIDERVPDDSVLLWAGSSGENSQNVPSSEITLSRA